MDESINTAQLNESKMNDLKIRSLLDNSTRTWFSMRARPQDVIAEKGTKYDSGT